MLDLGCGSGILSIAALLLGADRAVACDIDEKCMDVAYENAALNGVGRDRYTVRWGDVVTDQALRQELGGPYDVVVANIVADVIKALASTVRPLVKEGGIFLCSGIIDDRAEEDAQCLRDNGWTCRGPQQRGLVLLSVPIKSKPPAMPEVLIYGAQESIQAARYSLGDTPMTSRKARANLLALS